MIGARADELSRLAHPLRSGRVGARPCFELHESDEIHVLDVLVAFFAFVGRERTLIRLGGKLIKVRLEFRIRFWELGEVFCELEGEETNPVVLALEDPLRPGEPLLRERPTPPSAGSTSETPWPWQSIISATSRQRKA